MKTSVSGCLVAAACVSLLTGCSTLLPSEDKRAVSRWQSFDEAQAAFDQIIPHQTTVEGLKKLGFNPDAAANVKVLTYLDVIQRFLPNQSITKEDLPTDIRNCLEAKEGCRAYELDLDVVKGKRFGNVLLDMFGFKKKTHITGWRFKALVILNDGVVTYKLRSGEPNVDRLEKKTKPLGPLQELDGVGRRVVREL